MAISYTEKANNTMVEAGRFDADDLLAFGPNYFSCGWGKELYYNHSFSIALALIGLLYGDKSSGRSDYHNGIAYLANKLKIKKRQVKVIRKKMKYKGGFCFKTPFNISCTIETMIRLLKEHEEDTHVKEFLAQHESKMYREVLIAKQFESIKEAAKKGKREKVKLVADELRSMTTKVGE